MAETLEEGYRSMGEATIHDVADAGPDNHEVVMDFPTQDDVIDTYRTSWRSGVFTPGLEKRLPVMLWNHNQDILIGSGVRHENLGQATRIVSRFADFSKVPKAEEAHSLISDGHFPGVSFHYINGRTERHPSFRSARRFTRADLLETSPVVFPSIPGAKVSGIRSQEATLEIPTLETILKLKDDGMLDDEGVRSLIEEHYPHLAEHITIGRPAPLTDQQRIDALLAEHAPDLAESFRSMTVQTGAPTSGGGGDTQLDSEVVTELVKAADNCLDEAVRSIDALDVASLPEDVQNALQLSRAAGAATVELRETLGIDAPEGNRAAKVSEAPWDFKESDYTPEQLRSACLVSSDNKGDCHLPVKEPDGTLNRKAVHAAAGALSGARGGVKIPESAKKTAANKLMGLYGTLGEKAPPGVLALAGTGSRSQDTDDIEDVRDQLAERFGVR